MDFGVFIQRNNIDDLIVDARDAANHGFGHVWTPQITDLDAVNAMALVAREVPEVGLGTAVVPTYPRHPTSLAAQALTTQQASGGRFTLGIGLSHQVVIEGMYGMDWSKPISHMNNYLDILLPLLDGGSVDVTGDSYTYHGGLSIPADPVPTLVAALGAQMLGIAGARTAGTITWMTGSTTLANHVVPTITAAAERAGRPSPAVVQALPVAVTDDVATAKEACSKMFEFYGYLPSYRAMLDREGAAGPVDVAVIGDRDTIAAAIDESRNAGATHFVVVPFFERAATLETVASLMAE